MGTIQILKKGITSLQTDALVNAANEGLWQGGGVCGIIFNAAGASQLQAACNAIGGCKTGSAVITPGFNLKSKYIIHAVGPRWTDGKHNEPKLLYSAYKQSLTLAVKNDCKSIGFPLISAGIFGYPVDKAWRKALQACLDYQENNPDVDINIQFAVIDDDILSVGIKTLNELKKEKTTLYLKELNEDSLNNIKHKFSKGSEKFIDKKTNPIASGLLSIFSESNIISGMSVDQLIKILNTIFPRYVLAKDWLEKYSDILLRVIDETPKLNSNMRARKYETHLRTNLINLLKKEIKTGDVLGTLDTLEDIYKVSVCLYRYYSEKEKEFIFRANRDDMKKMNKAILNVKNIGNQVLGITLAPVWEEERQYAAFLSWVLEELVIEHEEMKAGDEA